jgi:RNA polymerase sigma-70 factor (ECF subfamily)
MDETLIALLACDPDAGFERLVLSFQDRIYGLALTLTGSPADAEEVAQDTFVRAHRALRGYGAERVRELRLRAWLHRIALNVVRNRVRRATLKTVDVDGPAGNHLAARQAEQPEAMALDAERRARVAEALLNLPERYATAVALRHIQGLSYVEVAEVLEQPVGTTKSDVHRGLRLLREALEADLLLELAGSH